MLWIPIEANPDVINMFMSKLGVEEDCKCVDVYGTDTELLDFIPRPVLSLLLLYPLTEAVSNCPLGEIKTQSDLIFIKQTIGNACGTIGLLHSLCNNRDNITFAGDSYLDKLCNRLLPLNPEERAAAIEDDEFLGDVHQQVALEGQTEAPDSSVKTELHFVSFIHKNGGLYEMDGREEGPKYHGPCDPDSFLTSAVAVIKDFMKRDPTEYQFSIIALIKN